MDGIKETIIVNLAPEMHIVLGRLNEFYGKNSSEVIEMALEHLAADAKLMIETAGAYNRNKGKGK